MSHSQRSAAQPPIFGKRKEPHTIIIAHGDSIKHFTIKPWMALTSGALLAAMALGYLVATSYLVLRDDLIGATIARQARLQHAYEDRISALRTQVDRITSRQLLDQQLMESKVVELIERQEQLTSRDGELGSVMKKARAALGSIPVTAGKPDERASLLDETTTGSISASLFSGAKSAPSETTADRADRLFVAINRSLKDIDTKQIKQVRYLADTARTSATKISDALAVAGYRLKSEPPTAEGGPFIAADSAEAMASFRAEVEGLDSALNYLKKARKAVRLFPFANPAPGSEITSSFGARKDPLLGTAALHSGMDFRASIGDPVKATAYGKVISSGRNGGYGNMVEIDHSNGLATRYAHMSRLLVSEGDEVEPGTVVGLAGSTGRSTGPHLHYEVRKENIAVDPAAFIRAGRKIEDLL
jgi:murein DD-endopeptidase MepM/ murein hydrolase activator NlpD